MKDGRHHIHLVAAFEIRPPAACAAWALTREQSRRLGAHLADDLAALAPEVVHGHLVTGPALLEPAQVLHPDRAPWDTMRSLAGLGPGARVEAGVTALGTHAGRAPGRSLLTVREPPRGLFVVLPMLLATPGDRSLAERLEAELFERGGLRPPAMGTLAEATGLDPVHGQLMTRADLVALLKVQLAGVGLDPFWPPVEHVVLDPDEPASLELPGGLHACWEPSRRRWRLDFVTPSRCRVDADWLVWLRAFRQTGAMLESHMIDWHAGRAHDDAPGNGAQAWLEERVGPDRHGRRAWIVAREPVGVIGISAVVDGERRAYHPLAAGAVDRIRRELLERGATGFAVTADLDWLRPGC